MNIETLPPMVTDGDFGELVTLLTDCVEGGASIGFLAPVPRAEVEAYWRKVIADHAAGGRVILVAREAADGRIAGSAQAAWETKANGRHRAEVQKVMVRPSHRRRGLAARLMAGVEAAARARGVRLLFLDTSDSHSGARELYEALRYVYAGGIPGYALDPGGKPEQNAIFYKVLA
jgi:GNAT superfamily N-acetyltransferase